MLYGIRNTVVIDSISRQLPKIFLRDKTAGLPYFTLITNSCSMSFVQSFTNNTPRPLTVFTQSGNTWTSATQIQPGDSLALPTDGLARNIWDSSLHNLYSSSTPNGWTVPNPAAAGGGVNRTNVIFINNSNSNFTVGSDSSLAIPANSTTSLVIRPTKFRLESGTFASQPVQFLPLPDQIVTINSDNTNQITNVTGNGLLVTVTYHNCFTTNMYLAQQSSPDEPQQNFHFSADTTQSNFLVLANRPMYLIRFDRSVISGSYQVPSNQSAIPPIIYFKPDGSLSSESCTGGPITQPPSAPSDLTATAASTTEINLFWTNNSGPNTSFRIQRRTGSSGTFSTITTVTSGGTAFVDTGLAENTEYQYQVQAFNSSGSSDFSNTASATTKGRSFLARWWWVFLIIVIIIIVIIIIASASRGKKTKSATTTHVVVHPGTATTHIQ